MDYTKLEKLQPGGDGDAKADKEGTITILVPRLFIAPVCDRHRADANKRARPSRNLIKLSR